MSNNIVALPYEYYPDPAQGRPVYNGSIYVGLADTDPTIPSNQKTLTARQEDGNEVPIDQPVKTNAGGLAVDASGNVVVLLVDGPYSIAVRNKNDLQVYYSPNVTKGEAITTEKLAELTDLVFETVDDVQIGKPIGGSDGDVVLVDSNRIRIEERAYASFKVVLTSSVTPNGFNVIQLTLDPTLSISYIVENDEVSAVAWGAVNDGGLIPTAGVGTDNQAALESAWNFCVAARYSLHLQAGGYRTVGRVRWGEIVATSNLRDLGGITLRGDGANTMVWTDFGTGADAFNFNNCKNVIVRDIASGGVITDFSGAGSNGFSVTNGWDNLSFINIYPTNMPYVDKGGFFDGGQGFTIQPAPVTLTSLGSITVRGLHSVGSTRGVGYDPTLVDLIGKTPSIDIQGVVEDCYQAVVVSSAGASSALPVGLNCGMTVDLKVINCQQGVVAGRGHGVKWTVDFQSNKTRAEKQLNPNGDPWIVGTTDVLGVVLAYAKNSTIRCTGNIGDVDKKCRIGFGSPGSSGLSGNTEYSDIYLDLAGTSAVEDIEGISEGLFNSIMTMTNVTASSFPVGFNDPGNKNILNVLGNYTEAAGNWTPILADTNLVDAGATYSSRSGTYEVQGNTCFFSMFMTLTSLGSLIGGSAASILGLPTPSASTSGNVSAATVGFASNLNLSAPATVNARVGGAVSHITLSKWEVTSTAGDVNLTVSEVSADGTLVISGSYRVA